MNPWKIATIAIALVTGTAFTTGLTTAYLLRPATSPAASLDERGVPTMASLAPQARVAPAVLQQPRVSRTTTVATPAPPREVNTATVSPAVVRPVSASTASTADCSTTTGDRVWRIAKPGLIGAVLGAGLGAAGGAIANGGRAAGKGAVIGGLAGAALGGGYGAYKTKQACGSVLGSATGFSDATLAPIAAAPQTAFGSPSSDGFTVYNAR
jgi:hypothetical protein